MIKKTSVRKNKNDKITAVINIPDTVSAVYNNKTLLIKGPNGEVSREFKHHGVGINVEDKKILLEANRTTKESKKTIGSLTAHIRGMIKGSQQAYVYKLKICSGHFPMTVSISNNMFIVKNFLGEKIPRTLQLKKGADIKVEGDIISITSASKEIVGQMSADIEQLTRRPGFDTRVFQDGCYIISKDGKELK